MDETSLGELALIVNIPDMISLHSDISEQSDSS